jgi:hypothetical protein
MSHGLAVGREQTLWPYGKVRAVFVSRREVDLFHHCAAESPRYIVNSAMQFSLCRTASCHLHSQGTGSEPLQCLKCKLNTRILGR